MVFSIIIFAFFCVGMVEVCHSILCRLVYRSYSSTQVAFPVMTRFRKWTLFSIDSKKFADLCLSVLVVSRNPFWAVFLIGQKSDERWSMESNSTFPRSVCQPTIWKHKIQDFDDIFIGSWRWRPSAARFSFNRTAFFWKLLKPAKKPEVLTKHCLRRFIDAFKSLRCSKLMSLAFRTHLEKTVLQKIVMDNHNHPSATSPVLPDRALRYQSYCLIYILVLV